VIAEILFEDNRGVFRGQVGQDDIYEDACVYRFVDVVSLCSVELFLP
jgi:hypothetical protein